MCQLDDRVRWDGCLPGYSEQPLGCLVSRLDAPVVRHDYLVGGLFENVDERQDQEVPLASTRDRCRSTDDPLALVEFVSIEYGNE